MLTLDKIYHASYVLKDVIRQTNIVQARGICDDCDVYLKPENLQITGSFKVRGSGYKISQLTEEEKCYCLFCRQPRSGRCTCCYKVRYQVAYLSA